MSAELGNEYFSQVMRRAATYPDAPLEALIRDVHRPAGLPSIDDLYYGDAARQFVSFNHSIGADFRAELGDLPVWPAHQCDLMIGLEFAEFSRAVDQSRSIALVMEMLRSQLIADEIFVADIVAGSTFLGIKIPSIKEVRKFTRDFITELTVASLVAVMTPSDAKAPTYNITNIYVYAPNGMATKTAPSRTTTYAVPQQGHRVYRGRVIGTPSGPRIALDENPFKPFAFRDARNDALPFIESQRYRFEGWWEMDQPDFPVFVLVDVKII